MKCPTCGKLNQDRALFCDSCGTVLSAKTAARQNAPEQWVDLRPPRQATAAASSARLVKCGICFALVVGLCGAFAAVLREAWERALTPACAANMKQIGLALSMYSADYDGYLPLSHGWEEGVYPYLKNSSIFICPRSGSRQTKNWGRVGSAYLVTDYGFNCALSGSLLSEIKPSDRTVLIFESNGARTGDERHVARPGRHRNGGRGRGNNFVFADGRAKWFRNGTEGLVWTPIKVIAND